MVGYRRQIHWGSLELIISVSINIGGTEYLDHTEVTIQNGK